MFAYLTTSLSYYSHNKPGTSFNVKCLQLCRLHGQMVSNVISCMPGSVFRPILQHLLLNYVELEYFNILFKYSTIYTTLNIWLFLLGAHVT